MSRGAWRVRTSCVLLTAVVLLDGIIPHQVAIADPQRGGQRPLSMLWVASPVGWDPLAQVVNPECDIRGSVDSPLDGAEVPAGSFIIRGWAADQAAPSGPGLSAVRITLDAAPAAGGTLVPATYGDARPDVAAALGHERFTTTGFAVTVDGSQIPPGPHVLYVQMQSACGWTALARPITVVAATGLGAAAPGNVPSDGAGGVLLVPSGDLGVPAPSPTSTVPAPINVTAASSPQGDAVTLSWTPPPVTIIAYRIVSTEADGSQHPLLDVPGSQVQATVTGLDPRVGYSFAVLAVGADGQPGAPSSAISNAGAPTMTPRPTPLLPPWCTPDASGGPPLCSPNPFLDPPGSPMGGLAAAGPGFPVTATLTDPTSATITWPALPGAVAYTILQGINGAPLQPWGPAAGTTAVVPLSQPGAVYVFQVRALGPNGIVLGVSTTTPPLTAGGGLGTIGGALPSGVPSGTVSQFVVPAGPVSVTTAPGGVTVTAQVRDAQGTPLANVLVAATAAPTGAAITPVQPLTDASGTATFLVAAPAGLTVTLSGTAAGIVLLPAVLTFVP